MIYSPDYLASSLFSIPLSFYQEKGFSHLLIDLDNTCDSYKRKTPSKEVIELFQKMKEAHLQPIIFSNNGKRRVGKYASILNVPYFYHVHKPSPNVILSFLKKENLSPSSLLLLGDQLLTDVQAAKRAGISVVLLSPLTKEEAPWTKINRLLEKRRRCAIIEKGNIPWIGESYEQN